MTVFRFALVRSFRNPFTILLLCVLPVGLVFVPIVPGSILPLGYHLYGQVIMFAAFLMVRTVAEDRLTGMLSRIAAAPVSYFRYLGETLLAYGLLLVAQNAVVVVVGAARYGRVLGSPVLQFAAFASFSLTSIAFSLAGCAVLGTRELAYSSIPLAITLLSLLGGF